MAKFSLATPSASIALLSVLTLSFLVALGFAYRCGASSQDLRVLLAAAFSNFSGALLLALKGVASDRHDVPEPPPAPPVLAPPPSATNPTQVA
jgi:hypothetical protein